MSNNPESVTSSTPEHGSPDSVAGGGSSSGPGLMPKSLGDLASRLVNVGRGGPSAPVGGALPSEEKRVGLSELSLRVLQRWGAFPLKVVAVLTSFSLRVGEEDAQLLGETTVDLVRHSAMAPDPRTEALARWFLAHACCVGEGYLATFEERLKKKRAESEGASV